MLSLRRADSGQSLGTSAPPGGLRQWLPVALWGGFVTAIAAVQVAVPAGRLTLASYLAVVVGAGLLAWSTWPRQRPEDRRAAAFIAAGVSFNAIADVIYE